jgi:hypothetical protein
MKLLLEHEEFGTLVVSFLLKQDAVFKNGVFKRD